MTTKTRNLVIAAMLAALACIATMIIKIPSPFKGYLHLGDCIVLLCGWFLPGGFGFAAAAIGSCLADIFSGYAIYAPATFVIKGLMALAAHHLCLILGKRFSSTLSRILSGVIASVILVLGYFVFEGFIYGFGPSVINIPANFAQGLAGLIIGLALAKLFEKIHIK